MKKMKMKKCSVEGCVGKKFITKYLKDGKYYCGKHKNQIRRYGNIRLISIYTPNEIIIKENYIEIILRNRKCKIVGKALIDIEDIKKCKKHKWHLNNQGYVISNINGNSTLLHRFLINPPENKIIDHHNRKKIDCRKKNLRITNQSINSFNTKISKNNTSGVVGVYWYKSKNKWYSQISKHGKRYFLGYFTDFKEAIEVRLKAELKYFGENPQRGVI